MTWRLVLQNSLSGTHEYQHDPQAQPFLSPPQGTVRFITGLMFVGLVGSEYKKSLLKQRNHLQTVPDDLSQYFWTAGILLDRWGTASLFLSQ